MATPDITYMVNIYPYPLVNLSIVSSLSRTYDIQNMGSYYRITALSNDEITVSADGYLSQTKTIVSDTNITLIPIPLEVSKLSNGTDTYIIRDDEARNSLLTKQDLITSNNKLSASLVSGLATVATSGSYNDLSNKPTIPTVTDTYSATSSDAMSGKAVASAGFLKSSDVTEYTATEVDTLWGNV